MVFETNKDEHLPFIKCWEQILIILTRHRQHLQLNCANNCAELCWKHCKIILCTAVYWCWCSTLESEFECGWDWKYFMLLSSHSHRHCIQNFNIFYQVVSFVPRWIISNTNCPVNLFYSGNKEIIQMVFIKTTQYKHNIWQNWICKITAAQWSWFKHPDICLHSVGQTPPKFQSAVLEWMLGLLVLRLPGLYQSLEMQMSLTRSSSYFGHHQHHH